MFDLDLSQLLPLHLQATEVAKELPAAGGQSSLATLSTSSTAVASLPPPPAPSGLPPLRGLATVALMALVLIVMLFTAAGMWSLAGAIQKLADALVLSARSRGSGRAADSSAAAEQAARILLGVLKEAAASASGVGVSQGDKVDL